MHNTMNNIDVNEEVKDNIDEVTEHIYVNDICITCNE